MAVIVHVPPMSERYKNNKVNNNNKTDNDNSKVDSITIHHLKQENKLLKYQIRKFQEGLNPLLHSNQVQIIIEKQTWKRFKRYSKDNDSVSEIINKLLDFKDKHKEERNNSVRFQCNK